MRTHSSQPESHAILGALWSICWRLWLLLPFFIGAIIFGFLDRWWFALACVIGFIAVVFVMRHFWPPLESDDSSDRPCDYYL
jgi:hypothetical protein